ncbi:hypothetical protein MNBD_PLANCTO03-18, partial [hydrothermal vent metagenome]
MPYCESTMPDIRKQSVARKTAPKKPAKKKPVQKKIATLRTLAEVRTKGELTKGSVAMYLGDCRERLPKIPEVAQKRVRLVFADPPFNWSRDYDRQKTGHAWDDAMDPDEYLAFTYEWLDLCIGAL